jgi:hypothetical protein
MTCAAARAGRAAYPGDRGWDEAWLLTATILVANLHYGILEHGDLRL